MKYEIPDDWAHHWWSKPAPLEIGDWTFVLADEPDCDPDLSHYGEFVVAGFHMPPSYEVIGECRWGSIGWRPPYDYDGDKEAEKADKERVVAYCNDEWQMLLFTVRAIVRGAEVALVAIGGVESDMGAENFRDLFQDMVWEAHQQGLSVLRDLRSMPLDEEER